jgi:hypothetical protein
MCRKGVYRSYHLPVYQHAPMAQAPGKEYIGTRRRPGKNMGIRMGNLFVFFVMDDQ